MWKILPQGVPHNVIALLSDQQAINMRLTCKDWCVQPCLDERARVKLNETLACQRLALKALKPMIQWDLGSALLFLDLFDTPTYRQTLSRLVNGQPITYSIQVARTLQAKKNLHNLLTEAVFKGPAEALENISCTPWNQNPDCSVLASDDESSVKSLVTLIDPYIHQCRVCKRELEHA